MCGDETVDYQRIAQDIFGMGRWLRIYGVGFDPNRAQTFQNTMTAMGCERYMRVYKQTNYYFTKAVEATEELLLNDRMTFDPNPINAYCFDNAVLDVDRMENRKPVKRSENLKIDGCVTAVMAVGMGIEQKKRV